MTALTHDEARRYLAIGYENLSDAERVILDAHLAGCAECWANEAEFAALRSALVHTLRTRWDGIQPARDLELKVRSRLRGNDALRYVFSFATSVVALALLVVVMRLLFATRTPATVDAPTLTPPGVPTQFPLPTSTPLATLIGSTPTIGPTPTPPSDRDFYTVQRLTTTSTGAYRPAVSPDGKRIAYASERDGNWDIYVLDLTSSVETRLTDDPLNDMAPSWSPDGTRLAYQHNVLSASGPVLVDQIVMSADGSNKVVVSSGAVWNGNDPPAWSPASDRLAFADRGEVVVVSMADQREVTRFKPTPGWAYADPIWIDQPFIAFTNNGTPVVGDTRDGVVGGVFYDTPGVIQSLVWSAARNRLGFIAEEGTIDRVVSSRADGLDAIVLHQLYSVQVENAAWSPDGRFIAIQSDAGVHVVNGETPSTALFTIDTRTPPSDLLSVSWLPDSSGLIVVAAIDGQPDLYLARLNLPAIEYFWSIAPISTASPVSGPQPSSTPWPTFTPFPTPISTPTLPSETLVPEVNLTITPDRYTLPAGSSASVSLKIEALCNDPSTAFKVTTFPGITTEFLGSPTPCEETLVLHTAEDLAPSSYVLDVIGGSNKSPIGAAQLTLQVTDCVESQPGEHTQSVQSNLIPLITAGKPSIEHGLLVPLQFCRNRQLVVDLLAATSEAGTPLTSPPRFYLYRSWVWPAPAAIQANAATPWTTNVAVPRIDSDGWRLTANIPAGLYLLVFERDAFGSSTDSREIPASVTYRVALTP